MAKKQEVKQPVTRAEKRDGAKSLIRELLQNGGVKSNDLIDEAAKRYAERFAGEETENPNDVKGRIGSVLDVMKKDGEVLCENGVCSLKTEQAVVTEEKKTAKATKKKQEKEVRSQERS